MYGCVVNSVFFNLRQSFISLFFLFFFLFATYCFLNFVEVAHDKNELI